MCVAWRAMPDGDRAECRPPRSYGGGIHVSFPISI
ncbi:hypothetical protein BPC006_I1776 [Burkholderia pseudomallei BPC006]|nr:hypothetical protein BPC006_I1776 [Burkholderia pseudomallei BPC006]